MDELAGNRTFAQFFHCLKPIVVRGAARTTSGVPKFECAGRNVFVTECSHSVACSGVRVVPDSAVVFKSTARLLRSAQVVLFPMLLFGSEMRVFRRVAQFHGPVLIFVVWGVVIVG